MGEVVAELVVEVVAEAVTVVPVVVAVVAVRGFIGRTTGIRTMGMGITE